MSQAFSQTPLWCRPPDCWRAVFASYRSTLADYSHVLRAVGSHRVAADLANASGNMNLERVLPTALVAPVAFSHH